MVGAIILVIWLIIYLFLSKFAGRAAGKILAIAGISGVKIRHVSLGIIFSGLLTAFLVWFVSEKGSNVAAIMMVGVTLIIPFLLALFFSESIPSSNSTNSQLKLGFSVGICYSIITAPWFVFFVYFCFAYASVIFSYVVNSPRYYYLCLDAKMDFFEEIKPAKSVLLSPDLFFSSQRGNVGASSSIGKSLLNGSTLKYIERPVKDSLDEFERIYTDGLEARGMGVGFSTKYVIQPIQTITSEYIVTSMKVKLSKEQEDNFGGSIVEVRRISDNKLVASTQYYWDKESSRVCPSGGGNFFVQRFLMTALNIYSEKSLINKPGHN